MAQISIGELYRGEGGGEKYGAGGIMGAVIKDLFTNGIPDGYDGLLWIELLTVTHTDSGRTNKTRGRLCIGNDRRKAALFA